MGRILGNVTSFRGLMPPRLQIDFGRTFPVEWFIDFDIEESVDISCATAATSGASALIFYEL